MGGCRGNSGRPVGGFQRTFVSPSAEFVEGERTGVFRIGKDDLLVSSEGRSWITFADYAIALIDEVETPKHSRQRFTVGY